MRHVFLITARKGSKRCKNKNFRTFYDSMNLVQLTVQHAFALRPSEKDPIILSTDLDDDSIYPLPNGYLTEFKQIGEHHWKAQDGLNFHYLRRPDELCTDEALHEDVLKHFVEWFKDQGNVDDYILTLMQPTSPFRSREHWEECIRLVSHCGFIRATTVDSYIDECDNNTGEFYVYSLMKGKTGGIANKLIFNDNIDRYVTENPLTHIDIDTEEDFLIAQTLAEHMPDSLRETILPL